MSDQFSSSRIWDLPLNPSGPSAPISPGVSPGAPPVIGNSEPGAPPIFAVDPGPAAPLPPPAEPAEIAPLPPSDTGGRDVATGRFLSGNLYGRHASGVSRRAAKLRRALYQELTPEDLRGVIRKLIEMALDGDCAASKLLLTQSLGSNLDLVEIVGKLEGLALRTRGGTL